MSLELFLDGLHARVVASPWLRRFTAFTRGLLAVGFLRAGLIKAAGLPFTQQSVETPVGYFFDAMYRTGGYWRFIGICQALAALLLLMPRPGPTVGALLFLPIILNIFIINVAVGFDGTWVITGLMSLAALYLVCWDYPRWKSVLFEPSPVCAATPSSPPPSWVLTLTTALGVQGLMEGAMSRGRASGGPPVLALVLLGFAVALPLVHVTRLRARARTG